MRDTLINIIIGSVVMFIMLLFGLSIKEIIAITIVFIVGGFIALFWGVFIREVFNLFKK